MKLKRGDIVIAVFPGELGKPRPAVILQHDDLNEILTTILACPMTTHVIETPWLRPIIVPTIDNGLQELSQIMSEKISPLRREVIRQRIGRLDEDDLNRLEVALLHIIGLTHKMQLQAQASEQGSEP